MSEDNRKTAVIIGAGPAGLTAAYELATRTNYVPVVVEANDYVGGISCTHNYKGNRLDIGGHRFFSKSDRVMDWWLKFMPLQTFPDNTIDIRYQGKHRKITRGQEATDPDIADQVMLIRKRRSRIFHQGELFDYPLTLSLKTISRLGFRNTIKSGMSYLYSAIFPIRKVENLEHYLINQFGRYLYTTFFKSYTEKVWGTPCSSISQEWGAQRIKGLSVRKAIAHAFFRLLDTKIDIGQKNIQTSLIEYFLYPKYGPGQLWEEVSRKVIFAGGSIHTRTRAVSFTQSGNKIISVATNSDNSEIKHIKADMVISTMPVQQLLEALPSCPKNVIRAGNDLKYRDFMTVGLLATKLRLDNNNVKDNWIYIQDPSVMLGRLQVYNNWSPYMVADPSTIWLGLEYFCNKSDALWTMDDGEIEQLAITELSSLGILEKSSVLDAVVIRTEKAYPSYTDGYSQFKVIRKYVDSIDNLYLIGRNGMHRYNNQDHSMLAAMTVVDNLVSGISDKDNIWEQNTDPEYLEHGKQHV